MYKTVNHSKVCIHIWYFFHKVFKVVRLAANKYRPFSLHCLLIHRKNMQPSNSSQYQLVKDILTVVKVSRSSSNKDIFFILDAKVYMPKMPWSNPLHISKLFHWIILLKMNLCLNRSWIWKMVFFVFLKWAICILFIYIFKNKRKRAKHIKMFAKSEDNTLHVI